MMNHHGDLPTSNDELYLDAKDLSDIENDSRPRFEQATYYHDSTSPSEISRLQARLSTENRHLIKSAPIFAAAFDGDLPTLRSILESGYDLQRSAVEPSPEYGCTPLGLAIRGNQLEAVQMLLEEGADPNGWDLGCEEDLKMCEDPYDGCVQPYAHAYNAIELAALFGVPSILEVLLERPGAQLSEPAFKVAGMFNSHQCLQMMLGKISTIRLSPWQKPDVIEAGIKAAASCWHVESVENLINYLQKHPLENKEKQIYILSAALMEALNPRDPIHIDRPSGYWTGVPSRLLQVTDMLFAHGANVNLKVNHSNTPFSNIFWMQSIVPKDIVSYLLTKGLDVNGTHGDSKTLNLSHIVRDDKCLGLVETFIARGADMRATCEYSQMTALHDAASLPIAVVLIKAGTSVTAKAGWRGTPLETAKAFIDMPDILRFVWRTGVNVDGRDDSDVLSLLGISEGTDPYRWCTSNLLPIIKSLTHHGADIHARGKSGETVLHVAVLLKEPQIDLLQDILEQGVDIDATDNQGLTALHCTSKTPYWNQTAAARFLLDRGAKVDVKNEEGETPLMASLKIMRAWNGQVNGEFVDVLLERGADRYAIMERVPCILPIETSGCLISGACWK